MDSIMQWKINSSDFQNYVLRKIENISDDNTLYRESMTGRYIRSIDMQFEQKVAFIANNFEIIVSGGARMYDGSSEAYLTNKYLKIAVASYMLDRKMFFGDCSLFEVDSASTRKHKKGARNNKLLIATAYFMSGVRDRLKSEIVKNIGDDCYSQNINLVLETIEKMNY